MKKPNALKTAAHIALILCALKLALDIVFIMVPEIALSMFGAPEIMKSIALPIDIRIIFVLSAVITTAPIGALAAADFIKTDMKHSRGVFMLTLAGVFYIIGLISDFLLDWMASFFSGRLHGADVLAVATTLNIPLNITGVLVNVSFAMVCCCAAVEIYGGERESAPYSQNNNGGNFQ